MESFSIERAAILSPKLGEHMGGDRYSVELAAFDTALDGPLPLFNPSIATSELLNLYVDSPSENDLPLFVYAVRGPTAEITAIRDWAADHLTTKVYKPLQHLPPGKALRIPSIHSLVLFPPPTVFDALYWRFVSEVVGTGMVRLADFVVYGDETTSSCGFFTHSLESTEDAAAARNMLAYGAIEQWHTLIAENRWRMIRDGNDHLPIL